MQDAIDFYLTIFKEISTLYTKEDETEVIISKKLSELIEKLKKTSDETIIRKAIIYILSIFENYYLDDYNSIHGKGFENIQNQEKEELIHMLETEILSDDYESATILKIKELTDKERDIIIKILKKELSK